MYYAIYILEKKGTCIFHQKFSEIRDTKAGPDLISGFFSAMYLFSKEIIHKKAEIMEIEDVRLVFRDSRNYIFVAIVDQYESIAQVQDILDKIIIKFFQNYEKYLENWDRDTELFKEFEKQIELIIIKADIDRMTLIEKLENLLDLGEDSKIKGVLILTSRADLMLSSIKDEKITRYIVKLIENNWRMGISIKEMAVQLNNHYIIIEHISDFLLAALIMDADISLRLSKSICKYLFKRLKIQVRQTLEVLTEN